MNFTFTVPSFAREMRDSDEVERTILADLEQGTISRKEALWNLAVLYSTSRRHDRAIDCLRKLVLIVAGPDEQGSAYLALGQLHEQRQDFGPAVDYYRAALGMAPGDTTVRYWLNNNVGYSLIQLGQYAEAELHLRAALAIDQSRPNAFKNLGLALTGQNKYAEACECFVRSTQANASDRRSLQHLEELVARRPELLGQTPDLQDKLDGCRSAVEQAASLGPALRSEFARKQKQQRPQKAWWAFWRRA
jgi:tetratricopeptide (TPR) repeat protein